ncbi:hypothetical protein QVD17_26170 [Tagetes erecta]|uniref:Transmembrane protein n=1 Tax=Tagetes erecta TaxID=13708 RepID=A0AAD8NQJ7_TARER|nr:hypothetical protein QVD17_26170 [Tagetes erecta]
MPCYDSTDLSLAMEACLCLGEMVVAVIVVAAITVVSLIGGCSEPLVAIACDKYWEWALAYVKVFIVNFSANSSRVRVLEQQQQRLKSFTFCSIELSCHYRQIRSKLYQSV